MSTKVRPSVLAVAVGLILLSVLAVVAKRFRSEEPQTPQTTASQSVSPSSEQGTVGADARRPLEIPSRSGSDKTVVRKPLPRATKVILKDGRLVPAGEGRASLSDPGVMAVVYEGAPPAAVQRLKEILESGSNEYPDFTLSEKYPPWVYDKIREMIPGKLGEVIASIAEDMTKLPIEQRVQPYLDFADAERTGYGLMYLVSDQAKKGGLSSTPVADTKFGIAVVSDDGIGPAEVAVWLAHRLAAGDERIKLPRIPPEPYKDWQSWVRDFSTEEYARQLEDEGILPKRSAR
jgi:hypothetical protein